MKKQEIVKAFKQKLDSEGFCYSYKKVEFFFDCLLAVIEEFLVKKKYSVYLAFCN